jgi:UDP-3-O-[3-hydroxymyristoyl] glucosamine N-acyltransferase
VLRNSNYADTCCARSVDGTVIGESCVLLGNFQVEQCRIGNKVELQSMVPQSVVSC